MPRRLFHRNILLIGGVVLLGQLLAGVLIYTLVLRPQTARLADVTATMVDTISSMMVDLPEVRRTSILDELNAGDNIAIRPASQIPSNGARYPSLIERLFMRALADRLHGPHDLIWRTDRERRLWVLLSLGGRDYWVSIVHSRLRGPMMSTAIALLTSFLVALAGGIFLQRHLDRPLRALATGVEHYDPEHRAEPLDEHGPEEVAAVARAFNHMAQRVADQEVERALMLAGVSHDLRTPLTKLRLALDMMGDQDADLRDGAVRQVERLETMLGQFLDFARGFEHEPAQPMDIGRLLMEAVAHSDVPGVVDDIAPGLSFAVRKGAILRAVSNLLVNAQRHGIPPFRLRAQQDANGLVIAVGDGGPGLTNASAEHLKRAFARGDAARGGEGTGLGLVIVDRAVQAHGGCLDFSRNDGLFWVTITLPHRYERKSALGIHGI